MKKILMICMAAIMAASMCMAALAAPGGFISSPPGQPAPEIDSFTPVDDDCTAGAVITPYGDRDELTDAQKELLEEAYNEIVNADNLAELNVDLAKLAEELDIDVDGLAVSDFFDIHEINCENHEEHKDFVLVLNADTLKNFVCLLHMNKDGEWELVSDAEVIGDGTQLKFSVDSFSPFAIVVNTTTLPPQTNDNGMFYIYLALMVLSAVALVVVAVKIKKQNA